jgi:hypothetical protein
MRFIGIPDRTAEAVDTASHSANDLRLKPQRSKPGSLFAPVLFPSRVSIGITMV